MEADASEGGIMKKVLVGMFALVMCAGMAMATGLGESDWRCAGCNQYVFSGPDYVKPTYYKNRTYHSSCADNAKQADEARRARQEQRAREQEEAKKEAAREAEEAKKREERQRQKEEERESKRIREKYPELFIGSDFF